MKHIWFLLTAMTLSLSAAEITVDQYKKILAGKVTKTIQKEMLFFPMFEHGRVSIELSSPGQEVFKAVNNGTQKYIDGKYLLSIMKLPNGVTLTSILSWDEKLKAFCQWNLSPNGDLAYFLASKIKGDNTSLVWSGKFNKSGRLYQGTVTYSPEKINWEGQYFKDGKFLFREKGSVVKVGLQK